MVASCANPPEGTAAEAAPDPAEAGVVVAAVLVAGELAGACAAAGVSQAAAKAITHPMCFISTPGKRLEPEAQVRASAIAGSIGAALQSLKRPFRSC